MCDKPLDQQPLSKASAGFEMSHKNSNFKAAARNLSIAKRRVNNILSTQNKISDHKKEIQELALQIHKRRSLLDHLNRNAIKIQKIVRGFLIRKMFDKQILQIRENVCKNTLNEMRKNDLKNFASLGKKAHPAALKIFRFFCRMKFLSKVKRIEEAYQYFQNIKERNAEVKLRIFLISFHSIAILKHEKFLKFREGKLEKIRENLARFTIKNYLNENKITLKILKRKIRKYKRLLKTLKSTSVISNQDLSTKNTENWIGSSAENLKGENLGNILECASITSSEFQLFEQEKQEKIRMSRVSYNVAYSKELSSVLPYLYEKAIKDEVSLPKNHLKATSCMVSRMSETSPQRQVPIRNFKKKEKALPKIIRQPLKRFFVYDDEDPPNYMRSTLCSSMDERISNLNDPSPKRGVGLIEMVMREGSTLLNQTFTGYQRVNEPKRSISNFRKYDPKMQITSIGQNRIQGRARSSIDAPRTYKF